MLGGDKQPAWIRQVLGSYVAKSYASLFCFIFTAVADKSQLLAYLYVSIQLQLCLSNHMRLNMITAHN